MYQRCKRCVMDNAADETIRFDPDGYCNYCTDVMKRLPKEYFPNEGEQKLVRLFNEIKAKCGEDKYDCMVGVSGGVDSSYILYLGYRYGLRMLAVHIDDGLDDPIAVKNIESLIKKTNADYISIQPNREEFADVIYSLLKASVSNLAIAQDNLIIGALQKYGVENRIRYILDGSNMAHESILEREKGGVYSADKKFIKAIHKMYGRIPLRELEFISMADRYVLRNLNKRFIHIRPLNFLRYDVSEAIEKLNDFCGFEYYGGKHYESVLTRFMQCYYLPKKFGIDKRKSHFSSLILSGQMTRDEALEKLDEPLYKNDELLANDMSFLADYLGITIDEFEKMIAKQPRKETEYPHSLINELAPLARKVRRFID